jgi:hypothetical protein
VDRGPVPNDQELAADLAQEQASKPHHVLSTISRLLHLHVDAPLWRDAPNR